MHNRQDYFDDMMTNYNKENKKNFKDTEINRSKINNKDTGNVKKQRSNSSQCPFSKKCGGCEYMDKTYDEQLGIKAKWLKGLLKPFCKVEGIIGMEEPYHYRNKVHAVFGIDRGHNIISGTYEAGTHKIVPIDTCLIENEKADEIIATIRQLLKSFKIKTYDEDTGYGLLRHVLIRVGHVTGQIMVVLVLSSPVMPSKNNFVKALREKHPEITTIVVNVNNKNTSMVLGDKQQVIYGKGYIEDVLLGKTFRISPKSFYQVNSVQTEKLYNLAIKYASLTGKERVVDAYCGTGTIGMAAADKALEVIGVELNADAVKDAVENAKRNNIKNISFYNNDAGNFLLGMAEQHTRVDVLLMDPPRSGSSEQFLDAIRQIKPKRIVYISCNPETLARDLKIITKMGYKVDHAAGVDMFPWTAGLEACVSVVL